MKRKLNKISFVIPVYNEAEGVSDFLWSLYDYVKTLCIEYEFVIVDDGSTDNTMQELLSTNIPNLKILQLSRNFGKETALTAGIDHCSGDATILIDGDAQHPVDTINQFLEQWQNGYDMVYGVRQNRESESLVKRWFTKRFYRIMQKLSQVDIVPNAGDFRLLDQKVINSLRQCEERGRFMKGLYSWVGFKSIGVPFTVIERKTGQSSWSFKNLLELAITGITSFSNVPLRIWSFAGFLIAMLSFVYALFIIIKTMLLGVDLPGYASIMVAIFFFCGIQLCSVGILGEYIARIFNEVKRRPKYIIQDKIGF